MYEYFYNRFQLGQRSGIELAGEASGIVISPDDPEGNAPRYANMTFGQGLDVTPLQVASAFSAVVNGGVYHQPTVVQGTLQPDGEIEEKAPTPSRRILQPGTSETMRSMIHQARQAFYADADKKGFVIGGKTGTAQTIENGKYVFSTTEGTYVGFGGEKGEDPQYVILVTYASPGKEIGGQQVIPTFTEMSNWMLEYLKLQPKG
jgi:cell division protein FtsI/penicillin-binding protein 2